MPGLNLGAVGVQGSCGGHWTVTGVPLSESFSHAVY